MVHASGPCESATVAVVVIESVTGGLWHLVMAVAVAAAEATAVERLSYL